MPPPWVRSIHGAVLWAFFAAARLSLPGVAFRTDRKAVLDIFRAGRKEATASTVELAQLWRMLFDAFDDCEDAGASVDIEWMPAHTAGWQVGKSRKGDGTRLTLDDRRGNDIADKLAKEVAKLHRVPAHVRN